MRCTKSQIFALLYQMIFFTKMEAKMKSCGTGYCVSVVDQCGFIDLQVVGGDYTNSYNKNLCITGVSTQSSFSYRTFKVLSACSQGREYWHVKFSTFANNNERLSFTWLSTGWSKVKGFMKFLEFRCSAGINQYCCNQLC